MKSSKSIDRPELPRTRAEDLGLDLRLKPLRAEERPAKGTESNG